ncbi:MAG: putative DNA-binding domain-containing protein [Halioglobus sp.]
MASSTLRASQMRMANFLRNPDTQPAPENIEPRRLKIYQDLVYNNIEGFISSGFPVLRSLYTDESWHEMVRLFINGHRCHSPYFLEISQEFLNFLLDDYELRECDPAFMAELAHYEWVELALDVSQENHEEAKVVEAEDLLNEIPRLSPLAWVLAYQYPVHRIGPQYLPDQLAAPTYLVVYRNRDDAVKFMEINAATARLLELVRENQSATGTELLIKLATELQMPGEKIIDFGTDLLVQFAQLSIICPSTRA